MTCTCGQPTEGGALLCWDCAIRANVTAALARGAAEHRWLAMQYTPDLESKARCGCPACNGIDLESDAMPPGAEGAD